MYAFRYQSRPTFRVNELVAVVRPLPWGIEVINVTRVKRVGNTLIETDDHRLFTAEDGASIGGRFCTYIEPANLSHITCRWH